MISNVLFLLINSIHDLYDDYTGGRARTVLLQTLQDLLVILQHLSVLAGVKYQPDLFFHKITEPKMYG